jgi:hypothetical protein
MATMMRAEAPMDARVSTPPRASEPLPPTASNVVPMIQPPTKTGNVESFVLACVGRAEGSTVSWAELYVRYRRWCAEQNLVAMTAEQFGKRLDALRANGLLRSRAKGDEVFCLDVKLVA